ncbi:DUF5693 family protein [Oceanotoga sp. DSM 15011]|uniref:DUF5693 family protein n=1 Tax=Oceanotoga sp. DSM 15011 TaxID=2984951 RepID=UPI0021F488C6|nr:DUF5693 family protein [Oceanotoga sp. DSM 15011]UYO99923.1 DUF5693 family protein [Oceanotoga sp. DSM 15011]
MNKKFKRYVFIFTSFIVSWFVIYSTYFDMKNISKYTFLPNLNELEQITIEDYNFYEFKNTAILKNASKNPIKTLEKISNSFQKILIIEFSDFDKQFTNIKDDVKKTNLDKINYSHFIKYDEIEKYDDGIIIQRFIRALKERKINYFIFPNHPRTETIKKELISKLGEPSNITTIKTYTPNKYFKFLSFGTIIIIMSLYLPLSTPIYIILYIFFHNWSFAFAGIIFSIIIYYKISNKNLIKILPYSVVWGILIYMSGYDPYFIFKLNNIRGIKLLLLTLPFLIFIKNIKNISFDKLKKSDIILLLLIFFSGIIYLLRSSNFGFVMNTERKIRDFLEKTLIARPRTKEFISYFFFFAPSIKGREIVWELSRSLLIVSVIDTFLHIHTPVYLGIIRTFNGFFISVLILTIFNALNQAKKKI